MIESIDIEKRAFVSTWSGKTYEGYYLNGLQVGCTCGFAQHHPFTRCKHAAQYNEQVSDVTPHIEDELRGSCCYCGRPTKGIICWKCLS